MTQQTPKLYTCSEAAIFLGYRSSSQIRGLCRELKIKASKNGRDWIITETALINYKNQLQAKQTLREIGIKQKS